MGPTLVTERSEVLATTSRSSDHQISAVSRSVCSCDPLISEHHPRRGLVAIGQRRDRRVDAGGVEQAGARPRARHGVEDDRARLGDILTGRTSGHQRTAVVIVTSTGMFRGLGSEAAMVDVPARRIPDLDRVAAGALDACTRCRPRRPGPRPFQGRASCVTTRKSSNAPADTHVLAEGDGSTEACAGWRGQTDAYTATQSAQAEGTGDAQWQPSASPSQAPGELPSSCRRRGGQGCRGSQSVVASRARLDGTHCYDGSPSVTVIAAASRYAPLERAPRPRRQPGAGSTAPRRS